MVMVKVSTMLGNSLRQGLTGFGLAIAALSVFSPAAQADNIFANNPVLNSLTFVATRNTSGLAIPLTNNTALPATSIGNVNIQSNTVGGFRVEVQSTNAGLLKRSTGETIAYTLNYNTIDKGQIVTTSVMEDNNALITDCADATGCNRDVKISISQSEIVSKPAGDYSDTLTFSLTNK